MGSIGTEMLKHVTHWMTKCKLSEVSVWITFIGVQVYLS